LIGKDCGIGEKAGKSTSPRIGREVTKKKAVDYAVEKGGF